MSIKRRKVKESHDPQSNPILKTLEGYGLAPDEVLDIFQSWSSGEIHDANMSGEDFLIRRFGVPFKRAKMIIKALQSYDEDWGEEDDLYVDPPSSDDSGIDWPEEWDPDKYSGIRGSEIRAHDEDMFEDDDDDDDDDWLPESKRMSEGGYWGRNYYDTVEDVRGDLKKGWIGEEEAEEICEKFGWDTDWIYPDEDMFEESSESPKRYDYSMGGVIDFLAENSYFKNFEGIELSPLSENKTRWRVKLPRSNSSTSIFIVDLKRGSLHESGLGEDLFRKRVQTIKSLFGKGLDSQEVFAKINPGEFGPQSKIPAAFRKGRWDRSSIIKLLRKAGEDDLADQFESDQEAYRAERELANEKHQSVKRARKEVWDILFQNTEDLVRTLNSFNPASLVGTYANPEKELERKVVGFVQPKLSPEAAELVDSDDIFDIFLTGASEDLFEKWDSSIKK